MPQRLTVTEAAELAKISPSTWRAYVARGQAPEADGRFGRTPYWNASTVRRWLKSRPSALLVLAFLAVALLTACGADEPTARPVSEPSVTATATSSPGPVDIAEPGARREIVRRVDAGECFSISFGSSAVEWSEWMSERPESSDGSQWQSDFASWISDQPVGCDDTDRQALSAFG